MNALLAQEGHDSGASPKARPSSKRWALGLVAWLWLAQPSFAFGQGVVVVEMGSRLVKDQICGVTVPVSKDRNAESQKGDHPIGIQVPPIKRRLAILWCGGFVWAFCFWLGFERFWGRRFWHSFVIVCGYAALLCGLLLWCLTEYDWTWGWWL